MKQLRWIPILAYAGLIFYLSSRPWSVAAELPTGTDKLIHGLLYACLGFGLVWALRATRMKGSRLTLLLAATIGCAYGITDEIHQSFVPGRFPSVADVIADGIGSFVGAWIAVKTARRMRHGYVPHR